MLPRWQVPAWLSDQAQKGGSEQQPDTRNIIYKASSRIVLRGNWALLPARFQDFLRKLTTPYKGSSNADGEVHEATMAYQRACQAYTKPQILNPLTVGGEGGVFENEFIFGRLEFVPASPS